jgi:hypothetical protein
MKKKKRLKWILAAFSLPLLMGFVSLSFPATGQPEAGSGQVIDACSIFNSSFQHGEELTPARWSSGWMKKTRSSTTR